MSDCWLFHSWGKWEQYRQDGTSTAKWGKMAGQAMPFTEFRQKRVCQDCGKMQDEEIND